MTLEEVAEGDTRLLVPTRSLTEVPRSGDGVFYNPEMALNRDLTVLAVQRHVTQWPDTTYLDAMAGTGARGIRIANETDADVVINDRSRDALDLVEQNLELNCVEAEIRNRDANALLSETGYDMVDIDPFGSPAPFTDSAARSLHMNGMLCLTATDTAPLCGAHHDAGRRRYDAEPLNQEHNKETGARVLLGFAARTLARYDLAATPLLTVYHRHYFRIFLSARPGAGRSTAALDTVGHLLWCPDCREHEFTHHIFNDQTCRCGGNRRAAGPMWTGPLHDADFVNDLIEINQGRETPMEKAGNLLDRIRSEVGGPPLYYDVHLTASRSTGSPPKIDAYIEALRDHGYTATRTHFDPEAVRTDAEPNVQEEVMAEMAK